MSEQEFSALVIDRLARIETGIDAMNQKLDRLAEADTHQEKKINDHESRLVLVETLLKSKDGAGRTVLTIIAGVVAVAAFALTILDRLYQ